MVVSETLKSTIGSKHALWWHATFQLGTNYILCFLKNILFTRFVKKKVLQKRVHKDVGKKENEAQKGAQHLTL